MKRDVLSTVVFTFHNMLQAVYLMSGFIIAAFIALINPEEGERKRDSGDRERGTL